MNARKYKAFALLILLFAFWTNTATAQAEDELKLRLSRNFGYSSGTGKIQGTFTMLVSGPGDLERVVFYIDGDAIGEVSEEPFRLRFSTGSYNVGIHSMHAVGYTVDGREVNSNVIKANFVSVEEGWQEGLTILGPILAIVFGVLLISFIGMFVTGRKVKKLPAGAPRNYGMAGGAICPRCGRPYSRHIWAPNLLVGKLERCPFCGKIAIVSARSMDELRAAEAAEIEDAQVAGPERVLSEQEKLRKDLEESRYQDF